MDTDNIDVTVAIEVNINEQVRKATASALTNVDPYEVAKGLLFGLNGEVRNWANEQRWLGR